MKHRLLGSMMAIAAVVAFVSLVPVPTADSVPTLPYSGSRAVTMPTYSLKYARSGSSNSPVSLAPLVR